jgi:hypothetical protein
MEIWLAIRPDTQRGTGTQSDPYNGTVFDEIMAATPPTSLIHIGKGTFRKNVKHLWPIRTGWIIQGAGMYDTTVQLSGDASGAPSHPDCLGTDSIGGQVHNGVRVRDLHCDGGWAELSLTAPNGANGEKNIKTGALGLSGNNNLIERVRSTNMYGSWANEQEQFGIVIAGPQGGSLGMNNIIRYCRNESPQGNYGAPFAMFGCTKSLVSHVYAKGKNDGLPCIWNTGGVNLANLKDCEISDSTFIDCAGAAYHDTDPVVTLRVKRNTVIRGTGGFINNSLNADSDIEVCWNLFEIQNRATGASYGIGNTQNRPAVKWNVHDNEIRKSGEAGHGYNEVRGISLATGANDAQILRNVVQGTDTNYATGARRNANRDAHGNVVPGLEDNLAKVA